MVPSKIFIKNQLEHNNFQGEYWEFHSCLISVRIKKPGVPYREI